MSFRTWLLMLMMRLVGGRFYPVSGPSLLILTGTIRSDHAAHIQSLVRPFNLQVLVLTAPHPPRVEAVITAPASSRSESLTAAAQIS